MNGNGTIHTNPAETAKAPARLRWYHSLYFRVALLCGVLLLCLLGSIAVITRYYYGEAIEEMKVQTQNIAEKIVLEFEENPEQPYTEMEQDLRNLHEGFDIELQPYAGDIGPATFHVTRSEDGAVTREARVPLALGDRKLLMTARVTVVPQWEILRAFSNKYMIALTALFLLTLGAMIYVISRALRPLRQLSETCAQIPRGKLEPVSTRGASGEILALEETFNDMVHALREKETVEAKLRQAQRLSALGNLAAGVAHDVRNPLNSIKLLSSHTLDSLDSGPSDARTAVKPLQTIRQEVERLENIVSGFLSLARESELNAEPCRMDELVQDCVSLIQKDAESRNIELVHEMRGGETVLPVDPKQWKRAILNVLLNALEATPKGGRVRLFTRATDRAYEIEIRDDGPGLDKEALDRVFEPYFTTKTGGTGLGLSITRGIVEEHGGRIDIFSSNGQGCQVIIGMPMEAAKTV